jgi:hypothetical protein
VVAEINFIVFIFALVIKCQSVVYLVVLKIYIILGVFNIGSTPYPSCTLFLVASAAVCANLHAVLIQGLFFAKIENIKLKSTLLLHHYFEEKPLCEATCVNVIINE